MTPEFYKSKSTRTKRKKTLGKRKHRRRHVDEYSQTMRLEKSSTNPLIAFAPKPKKTAFDSQMKEEEVLLLLRQHPFTQLSKVFLILIISLIPIVFPMAPFFEFLPEKFGFAFYIGWYMALTGIILETFLVWFFNVYIITDERIIDVDFSSVIHKNVSSAKLDNIEDITTTTRGLLASIINYGNIKIQTAAEKQEFEFSAVPQPSKVTALLNELLIEEEREKVEGRVN